MTPRRWARVIAISAASCVAIGAGRAQTKAGPSAPPGKSGGTTSPIGPTSNPNPTNPILAPIFLTGRVLLDDGSPPPEAVKIERVCGGSSQAIGFTDSQGNFTAQIGGQDQVFQDASESDSGHSLATALGTGQPPALAGAQQNSMDRRLTDCDLRAKLTGFRSQLVSLTGRRAMDSPDVGIILLHRDETPGGHTVSTNSLAVPKDARKAFDKGKDAARKGKPDEAYQSYQKAVSLYRDYAVAWCELGKFEAANGRYEQSALSFRESVRADAKFTEGYMQLAVLAAHGKQWQEMVDMTDQVIKLDAFDYPQAFLLNAVGQYNMRHNDLAEASALRAERLDTRHQFPQVEHLEGAILLARQDVKGAAEHFRAYLTLAPQAPDAAEVRAQLAKLEATAERQAEQQ
jgi:tetratricopeptide (TPR) repeat protein